MIASLAIAALVGAAGPEALRDPTTYSIQCASSSPDGRHLDFNLSWDRGSDGGMVISLLGTDGIMQTGGALSGTVSAGIADGTHPLEMRVLGADDGPVMRLVSRADPFTYLIDLHIQPSMTYVVIVAGKSLIPLSFGTIAVGWCKDIPRASGAKK